MESNNRFAVSSYQTGTISSAAQTHHLLATPYPGTANNCQLILNSMKPTSGLMNNENKERCQDKQNAPIDQKDKCKNEQKMKLKSSMYRGVCRYGRRYSAFLWDNTGHGPRRGAVYIGVSKNEVDAAKAYDLAAIKLWGNFACTNFPMNYYEKEIEEMKDVSRNDYLKAIRRKDKKISSCYSPYRGVSRSKTTMKWQARVGRGRRMQALYLGTFETQEEAARAYDIVKIKYKGAEAMTNFNIHIYDVPKIVASNLPIGKNNANKLKLFIAKEKFIRSDKDKGYLESGLHGYQNPSFVAHNGFTGNVAAHDTVGCAPPVSMMLLPPTWTFVKDSSGTSTTEFQFQASQPQAQPQAQPQPQAQAQQQPQPRAQGQAQPQPQPQSQQSHDFSIDLDEFQDLNIDLDQWELSIEKKENFSNKFNLGDSPINGILDDTPAGFSDVQLQQPPVEPNSDSYQDPLEDSGFQLSSDHVNCPWSDSDQTDTTFQSELIMTEDLPDIDFNEYFQSCSEEINENCASASDTNMGSESDQTNTAFQSRLTAEDLWEHCKCLFEETNENIASAANMGFAAEGPVLITPQDGNSPLLRGTNNNIIPSNELVYHLEGEEYLYHLVGGSDDILLG